MDQKLEYDRTHRNIDNLDSQAREYAIKRIQVSYGYDHENAEKVYELMRVKQVEQMWGIGVGAFAAYKFLPIQREMQASNAIMRKWWMRYPLVAGVFYGAYYIALQMPTRFFQKLTHRNEGISHDTYRGYHDLVGKFRIFENNKASAAEDQLLDHMAMYDKDPLSKPELVEHMMKRISEQTDLSKVYRIKRQGKDKNDVFWLLGKIHGLENIAFCDSNELEQVEGNPVKLQRLVNGIEPASVPGYSSHEAIQSDLQDALTDYKAMVMKMNVYESDRKKLLALPFALAKRQEEPKPSKGQASQLDLFKEMTETEWTDYQKIKTDSETKITEFDFENHLNQDLLKNADINDPQFKKFVRSLNFNSKTRYEAHHHNQEKFAKLMGGMTGLTDDEKRAMLHLIRNRHGKVAAGQEITAELMDLVTDSTPLEDLAKLSEKEHFDVKNRYKHQRETLDFAEKKRMPTDERNVRDMLRNQHIFRWKMENELPTYTGMAENPQFSYGLLQYLYEGAYGELGDLVKEVGIKRDSIPYYNVEKFRQFKDNMIHDSDHQFNSLMCALFTPLDMTDHEETFLGWNEIDGVAPITKSNWLANILPEPHPQIDSLVAIEELENKPRYPTSPTMAGLIADKYADPEEEEEEEYYGSEGGDDEDEYGDEDEEGGEEDYGDYGDYDEEADDDVWPPPDVLESKPVEDRFFRAGETLRGKYNDIEVENFMKLLGVRARTQWQDKHVHHHKMAVHQFEDEGQEVDLDYKLLSESERVHVDRMATKKFRSGSEVKLVVDGRKPVYPNYRF